MIELKCVICGKTEPSMVKIPNWVCFHCQEEEKEAEQNQEVEDTRGYGDHLQDWIK